MTLARQLLVGLALLLVAIVVLYFWLQTSGAFAQQDETGETLRLVCPLH